MNLFGNIPHSIFYVYGNVKFKSDIEIEIEKITETFFELPQPKYNLVGYKIVCYSTNDIARLDVNLSKYEGWIQVDKRKDFEDIEPGYFNFDRFATGCNNRYYLTGDEFKYFSHFTNTGYLAIRHLGFKNSSVDLGEYTISFNENDKIHGYISPESTIENNNIYLKNLNNETITLTVVNADLDRITLESENIFGLGGKEFKPILSFEHISDTSGLLDTDLDTYSTIELDFFTTGVYNVLPNKKYLGIVIEFTTTGDVEYELLIDGWDYDNNLVLFDYVSNHILIGDLGPGGKLKSGEKYYLVINADPLVNIESWFISRDPHGTYTADFLTAKIYDVTVV